MGTNTVLLCNTCKIARWSEYRVLFNYDALKKLSGKVGVRKIGRMVTLINEVDKFKKRMNDRGADYIEYFFKNDELKARFTEIKDFMVRHHGHNISVTGDYDDVPDPNDEWYADRGWKFEEES